MNNTPKLCTFKGCGRPYHSKGWCGKHYLRVWSTGKVDDPQRLQERHGMSRTPIYKVWHGMIRRCENPNDSRFSSYGGRGIRVCKRWRDSFVSFYADMGVRPSGGHSLDRINVDGDYEPTNCKWSTNKEQTNNTRVNVNIVINGQSKTLSEWVDTYSVKYSTVYNRIVKLKWDPLVALTTPTAHNKIPAKFR